MFNFIVKNCINKYIKNINTVGTNKQQTNNLTNVNTNFQLHTSRPGLQITRIRSCLEKIEDFGVHCRQYYSLAVSYFKSSLDSPPPGPALEQVLSQHSLILLPDLGKEFGGFSCVANYTNLNDELDKTCVHVCACKVGQNSSNDLDLEDKKRNISTTFTFY